MVNLAVHYCRSFGPGTVPGQPCSPSQRSLDGRNIVPPPPSSDDALMAEAPPTKVTDDTSIDHVRKMTTVATACAAENAAMHQQIANLQVDVSRLDRERQRLQADVPRLEDERQWWRTWHKKWGPLFRRRRNEEAVDPAIRISD